jgi:cobalt-zinc-cadmium efflux system membrane fusion protein
MKDFKYLILALALAGAPGCGEKAPDAGAREEAHGEAGHRGESGTVEVTEEAQRTGGIRAVALRRAAVAETFQALGRVMQDAQKPHHVAAGSAGAIVSLAALGQAVNAGDELAVIRGQGGAETRVAAPHKGIVTAVHSSEGDQVNEMSFLFTVTDIDPLWGVLDIPERELERVRAGQAADIRTAAYPGRAFKGTVAFVSPEIDPVSRTEKARVSIENPQGLLKFGMFIDAAVRTGAYFQGIAAPADAVQNGPAGPFVFVKTGKTDFVPRPVETGREKDGLVEIKKGLSAGESVVTEGAYLLKSEMMKAQMGEDEHAH